MTNKPLQNMSGEELMQWWDSTDDHSAIFEGGYVLRRSESEPPPAIMHIISVRLPVTMAEKVERVARSEGASRSDLIRAAITEYIDGRNITRNEAEQALQVLSRMVHNTAG